MNHLQLPVVITPTRVEQGCRCHRRHFLGDVLGKQRFYSASLEFGSVIHAGAAAHWLNRDVEKAITDEWNKRFEQNPKVSQESVSLQMALAMMDYYAKHAQIAGPFTDQGNWKRVDVEQRFELPLKDAKLSFQSDRTAYDIDQNWLVVADTKSAGRLDARWDKQWEVSLQMKLYKAGAKQVFQTGGRVDVVVEGLLKDVPSNLRYYVCPDWSDEILGEAAFNALQVASLDRDIIEQCVSTVGNASGDVAKTYNLAKAEELGVRFTPINYGDCYSYGQECPFRQICVAEIDERVALLRGEYWESTEESY